jgi:hypothetical protein
MPGRGIGASDLMSAGDSVLGGKSPSGHVDLSDPTLTNFERSHFEEQERQAASFRRKMLHRAEHQRNLMERRQIREQAMHKSKLAANHRAAQEQKQRKHMEQEEEQARIEQIEQDELNEAWRAKLAKDQAKLDGQQRDFDELQAKEFDRAAAMVHSRFESAERRTREVSALKGLFRRVNLSGSGTIDGNEMVELLCVVDARPTTKELRQIFKEFGATRVVRIGFNSFLQWWDDNGAKGHGVCAESLNVTVNKPSESGNYSVLLWVEKMHCDIDEYQRVKGATRIQSMFRGRKSARWTALQKKSFSLPGSTRPFAIRIQSAWRMFTARTYLNDMRHAQRVIAERHRANRARILFELEKSRKKQEGFDFANRTIHIGGVGGVWETVPLGEELLKRRFSVFGRVLTAVLRYRAPDEEITNNSWALLTFAHIESLDRLWSTEGGGGNTVLLEAQDCLLKVRRISPDKAMSSTGSFGQIFQLCLQRVNDAREKIATERRLAEDRITARDARLAQLAKPVLVSRAAGVGKQTVLGRYASRWLRCACSTTLPNLTENSGQQGSSSTVQQIYWFNELSGETRWDTPPELANLHKTNKRHVGLGTPKTTPSTPKLSAAAAGIAGHGLYTGKGRLHSVTAHRIAQKRHGGSPRPTSSPATLAIQTKRKVNAASPSPAHASQTPCFERSARLSVPIRSQVPRYGTSPRGKPNALINGGPMHAGAFVRPHTPLLTFRDDHAAIFGGIRRLNSGAQSAFLTQRQERAVRAQWSPVIRHSGSAQRPMSAATALSRGEQTH